MYVGRYLDASDLFDVMKYVTILAIVPIAISFLQYFGGYPYTDFDWVFGEKVGRVSGGYAKSVALVGVLFYVYLYLLYTLLKVRLRPFSKTVIIVYLSLLIVIIFLTYHRASISIFAVATLVLLFFYGRKRTLVVLLMLCSGLLFVYGLPHFQELFKTVDVGDSSHFLRGRGATWAAYMAEYRDSGVVDQLIGKGHSIIGMELTTGEVHDKKHNEPHSDYIRILYQYGLIGFGIFIYLMSSFFVVIWRSVQSKDKHLNRDLAVIGLAAFVGLCLYSVTIEPSRYPAFYWYFVSAVSVLFVRAKNN